MNVVSIQKEPRTVGRSLETMSIRNARYNSPEDYLCNGDIVFPDEENILRISRTNIIDKFSFYLKSDK